MLENGSPLSEWLLWLESLSPKEIDLGLERVQQILERLDLARPEHILLIAGTNGKGSSVAMTSAILIASGKRVGAYTSPHVSDYNERISVDGVPVSDAEIIAAFEKVEAARGDVELTYFEYGTLAALVIFAAADLDVWVLEVGLGGRLDATNAIEPTASLITNISLDHCDWLGHDVASIAAEKAGVMRTGVPTVFGSPIAPRPVTEIAASTNAILLRAGQNFSAEFVGDDSWNWSGRSTTFDSLQRPGLIGDFQIANAAAVLAMLEAAGLLNGVDADLLNRVMPALSLRGRSEILRVDDSEWLIDVAHNPAAAEVLAETLGNIDSGLRTTAIVGLLDDKDAAGIFGPLAASVDRWIAISADSHRAVPAAELARQIANLTDTACLVAESVEAAVEFARRNASENDRIVVTGSFFTVGPVLKQLAEDSRNKT